MRSIFWRRRKSSNYQLLLPLSVVIGAFYLSKHSILPFLPNFLSEMRPSISKLADDYLVADVFEYSVFNINVFHWLQLISSQLHSSVILIKDVVFLQYWQYYQLVITASFDLKDLICELMERWFGRFFSCILIGKYFEKYAPEF